MGIQTTITLTRKEALEKLVQKAAEEYKAVVRPSFERLSNTAIENELEGTFDNYMIVDEA